MLKRISFFSTLLCTLSFSSFAQEQEKEEPPTQKVTLHVIDMESQSFLPYAHIQYGKKVGITDKEGNITFDLMTKDSIQVSYVGYKRKTIYIDHQLTNEDHVYALVRLEPDTKVLEEISVSPFPTDKDQFKQAFLSDKFKETKEYKEQMRLVQNAKQNLKQVQNMQRSFLKSYEKVGRDSFETFRDQQRRMNKPPNLGLTFGFVF
ncbi:hypothetical protein [Sediminitomix flava]|uniref:Carboxypeptidase-like protein n=1 Tax=Sediminitomix flava TaxID=379075 RepID=A0A315Z8X6_SEDFL|nr:hypothetical protein [Sediminitomix flava]PWJ41840.1 hypothetical protein BC781_10390 [Sediminitomix flava]